MNSIARPVVRRVGDRITCIRFPVLHDRPWIEYQDVLSMVPDGEAKRAWMAGKQELVMDGDFAEVRSV